MTLFAIGIMALNQSYYGGRSRAGERPQSRDGVAGSPRAPGSRHQTVDYDDITTATFRARITAKWRADAAYSHFSRSVSIAESLTRRHERAQGGGRGRELGDRQPACDPSPSFGDRQRGKLSL